MFKQSEWRNPISLLAILCMTTLLVACGDEGDAEESSSSSTSGGGNGGAVLVCFVYLLVSGDDECLSYANSSSSSGGSTSSGSTSNANNSDDVILLQPFDEYEPNNEWLNANPIDFPKTTDRDGFIIDGEVQDSVDPVDVFSFNRHFLRYHAFQLCWYGEKFCDESGQIDTPTAYIEILDQSGEVLASSQGADTNYLRLQLPGGVAFFARVVANDTMAAPLRYRLVGHEANY